MFTNCSFVLSTYLNPPDGSLSKGITGNQLTLTAKNAAELGLSSLERKTLEFSRGRVGRCCSW